MTGFRPQAVRCANCGHDFALALLAVGDKIAVLQLTDPFPASCSLCGEPSSHPRSAVRPLPPRNREDGASAPEDPRLHARVGTGCQATPGTNPLARSGVQADSSRLLCAEVAWARSRLKADAARHRAAHGCGLDPSPGSGKSLPRGRRNAPTAPVRQTQPSEVPTHVAYAGQSGCRLTLVADHVPDALARSGSAFGRTFARRRSAA
jgi:hypothetical protein